MRIISLTIALMLGLTASAQGNVNPKFDTSTEASRVTTIYGDIAGFIDEGIYTYRGIPYAKADRYEEPQKPDAWEGVASHRWWGKVSLQAPYMGVTNDEISFFFHSNMGDGDDHCQHLNVWTPSIKKGGEKRPVLVWLHGGGFQSGSSQELPVYYGKNLAKKGDVVVVSVNHRLNCVGFLDLSSFGEQFKHSGNLGMMDIVKALEWVRDNIANFGGDPNNVTIFGQSGGGGKVTTLCCMPSAKGLFHRAMVMSGSFSLANQQVKAREVGERTVKLLGLNKKNIDKIKTIPYDQLWRAAYKALDDINAGNKSGNRFERVAWGPEVEADILPELPFRNGAELLSKDIPMIIGSTLNEFSGDQPDVMVRQAAIQQATTKFNDNGGKVWVYLFKYQIPSLDGHFTAQHSNDIGFFFNNVADCPWISGGTPAGIALGEDMSSYLLNFARTGNPNGKGLMQWDTFSPETEATMLFDVPASSMQKK